MVIVVVILGRGGGGSRGWPIQVGRDAIHCVARWEEPYSKLRSKRE